MQILSNHFKNFMWQKTCKYVCNKLVIVAIERMVFTNLIDSPEKIERRPQILISETAYTLACQHL